MAQLPVIPSAVQKVIKNPAKSYLSGVEVKQF